MNNTSKLAVIMAVVLALVGCAIISIEESDAAPGTIYVGGDVADDTTGDGTEAKPYATLDKALSEVASEGTVILGGDITPGKYTYINKNVTLNLNGHTIALEKSRFVVNTKYTLTIAGEGSITGTSTLFKINGTLNIENGTISSTGTSDVVLLYGHLQMTGGKVQGGGTAVSAKSGSNATISGGTLDGSTDLSATTCTVTLSGSAHVDSIVTFKAIAHISINTISSINAKQGSYFNVGSTFDCTFQGPLVDKAAPANMKASGQEGSWTFVQLDKTEDNDLIEAYIGEDCYRSLEIAVSYVEEDETITLNKDCSLDETLRITLFNVTLNLNGHSITSSDDLVLEFVGPNDTPPSHGSTISIIGNGSISTTDGTALKIRAGDLDYTMTFTIGEGVTLEGTKGKIEIGQGVGLPKTDSNIELLAGAYFESEHSDGTYIYQAFGDALSTSIDKTAKLVGNYEGMLNFSLRGDWTLDLNNYKIIPGAGDDAAIDIIGDGAHLTVKNGTIESQTDGIHIAIVSSGNSYTDCAVTLDNVKVYAKGSESVGIISNGMSTDIDITLTNGSLVECQNGMAIYFPSTGTLTVKDSSITGLSGVEVRKGNIVISGETTTITATSTSYSVNPTPSGGGSTVIGAAVAISPYSGTESMSVDISGGTLSGAVAFAQVNADGISDMPAFNFSISGGSFDSTSQQSCIIADESTGRFITGGTYSTDVDSFIKEGISTSQDSEGNYLIGVVKVTFEYGTEKKEVMIEQGSAVSSENIPAEGLPSADTGYQYVWMVDGSEWDPAAAVEQSITVIYTLQLEEPTVTISSSPTSGGVELTASATHELGSVNFTYEWSNGTTGESITVTASGTYTVTVTASDDSLTSTGTASYTVRFSYTAPAVGAGFSVEYGDDTATVTAKSGYELTVDGGTTVTDTITVGPGETFEVRRAASSTMDASAWTQNTSDARPAAPVDPDLHITSSTVTSTGDGILIKVGEGEWGTTVTGLSPGTAYTVQFRTVSDGSGFASEVGEVEVTTKALPTEDVTDVIENPDGTTTTITTRPDGSSTTSQTEDIVDGTKTTVVDTDPDGDVTQTVITETEIKNDAGDTVHTKEEVTTTSEDVITSKTDVTYTSEDEATVTKVTVETAADGSSQAVSQTTVSAPSAGSSVDKSTIDAAVTQMDTATGSYVSIDRTITIQTESAADSGISVSIEPDALGAIAESGAALKISGGIGSVTAPTEVAESLSGKTDGLTFSMVEADKEQMHPVQQEAVGNRPTYQMVITSGEEEFHDLGGTVTVSIPYVLGLGETAEALTVYYVDDDGNKEAKNTFYDEENHVVTFETNHFSYYVIGSPAEESAAVPVTFGFDPDTATAQIHGADGTLVGTAADGDTLNLAPGTYTVVVSADGYVTVTRTLTVAEGELVKVFYQQLSPVQSGGADPDEPVNPPHQDEDPYVPPVPPTIVYPDEVNVNLSSGGIDTTGILACAAAACAAAIFAMFAVFEYRRR